MRRQMIRLTEIAADRALRTDDVDDLGTPTTQALSSAIDAGDRDAAKSLAQYSAVEGKSLHDLLCDWLWDLFTQIANRHGEEEMHAIMRKSQEGWMMRRTWKAFLKMPVERRVQLTAEIMRAHRSGAKQLGELTVTETEDRYSIYMDPCGSGGRMRRGDPVDGTPSRLGAPYGFGTTSKAYDWSWGKENVPYYCLHCCLNELLPMEWGGHPLWVTGYDRDASKPCVWHFFKTAEAIPEEYYTRVGRKKPVEGLY